MEQNKRQLSEYLTVSDGVYVSTLKGLSLYEYIQARHTYCSTHHSNCKECKPMLNVAQTVLKMNTLI